MELKEFVTKTLVEIIEGVTEAQSKAKDAPGGVVPTKADPIERVAFDVALTTSKSKESKGGIGVFLGGAGIGGQKQAAGEAKSFSRIKFSVPILLPVGP